MSYTEGAEMDINITADININLNSGGVAPPPPDDDGGVVDPPEEPPQEPSPEVVVNDNPGLVGDDVVTVIETADGRYQAKPNYYEVVYAPGGVGVPPYVNYKQSPDGSQYLAIEVTQIDGRIQYSTALELPAGCYLLKLRGSWLLDKANPGQGSLSDIALGASIDGEADMKDMGEQALQDWSSSGKEDYIWAFEVSARQTVRVAGWVNVRWATLKGTINLYRFEVLRVGSGYCASAVKL